MRQILGVWDDSVYMFICAYEAKMKKKTYLYQKIGFVKLITSKIKDHKFLATLKCREHKLFVLSPCHEFIHG